MSKPIDDVVTDVEVELIQAMMYWPKFASAHEGYAILLEEVDELWDIVKLKPVNRDVAAMRAEAVQIAAMALRFIIDCCEEERE